ncbi:MAG: flagellar motor protein [Sulfuriferula sp.]
MDWGSIAGVVLALAGVLVAHMLDGGHIGSLIQPAAFVIVVIGTIGAVLLQNRIKVFVRGVRMISWVFIPPPDKRQEIVDEIRVWSHTARREGLLSLEAFMLATEDQFTAKGLRLIIDGTEPAKLREILDLEISAYESEQRHAAKIWEAAGGYSPTIGILGAVLGLIHVMENLSDPTKLGSGIAVAFVATIYGVGLANLVFLPIGHRLKTTVMHEVSTREMLADAFIGIANGDNPRAIDERMITYLR